MSMLSHKCQSTLLLGLLLVSAPRTLALDLRTWAFEASVVHVDDPQELFGDVQLFDTVRGTFSYDLDTPLEWIVEDNWADYWHEDTFPGMSLVIENPRTGGELRYDPAPFPLYLVSVHNGSFLYPDGSAIGFSYQPTGPSPGLSNIVYMDFVGPNVLSDTALPSELILNDWEAVTIYLDAVDLSASVRAQLHSLTPIVVEGDYNGNGWVEQADLDLVLLNWGQAAARVPDTWKNLRPIGSVDQDDLDAVLLHWGQTSLASGASTANTSATVPEPASIALCWVAASLWLVFRFRRAATEES